MSLEQLYGQIFSGRTIQVASKRLVELRRGGFIERRRVDGAKGRIHSAFLNTPKAFSAIADFYEHKITSPLCKSDSVDHDLALVNVRTRLEGLTTVTDYLTENVLQGCGKFLEMETVQPFVENNTDAAIELTRNERKLHVGLEFENSEKANERYIRKLVNYYSDLRTPVILYVCTTSRIRDAVIRAESEVVGARKPRCFYALASDVLAASESCTFFDLKGAQISIH